jgi:hypothetical protein
LKRKDGKFEANFTADVFSKLSTLNISFQGNIILGIMKIILPKCFKNMKHRGKIDRSIVNIIKSITKTLESWKGLSDRQHSHGT